VEQRAPLVGDPARAPAADLEISGLSGWAQRNVGNSYGKWRLMGKP
jgi:hypothetical protein